MADHPTENTEKPRKKNLRPLFNKVAHMGLRTLTTTAFKTAATAAALSLGASAFMTTATTVAAAGMASCLFSYGFDTIKSYSEARKTGAEAHLWDRQRAKKAAYALMFGVAGGALGTWFAHSDLFKSGMGFVRDHAGHKVTDLLMSLKSEFHKAAVPHHAGLAPHKIFAPAPPVAAPVPPPSIPAFVPAPQPESNGLQELALALKGMQHPPSALLRDMAHINTANPASITAQHMKDLAHSALRMRGVGYDERLKIARDLAKSAADRGNRQALSFLKDLRAPGLKDPLSVHAAAVAVVKDTVKDTAKDTAKDTLTEAIRDSVAEHATAVAPSFNPAAVCSVTLDASGAHHDVACVVQKAVMQPGDSIVCNSPDEIGLVSGEVRLSADSTAVPTLKFMHGSGKSEPVVSCMEQMSAMRRAVMASAPAVPAPAVAAPAAPAMAMN